MLLHMLTLIVQPCVHGETFESMGVDSVQTNAYDHLRGRIAFLRYFFQEQGAMGAAADELWQRVSMRVMQEAEASLIENSAPGKGVPRLNLPAWGLPRVPFPTASPCIIVDHNALRKAFGLLGRKTTSHHTRTAGSRRRQRFDPVAARRASRPARRG